MTSRVLLVGLGNPAPAYQGTRHNLGIDILRQWLASQSSASSSRWKKITAKQAEIATAQILGTKVTCLFPLTFMNQSGQALAAFNPRPWWRRQRPFPPEKILIIHDEIELPIGEVKFKTGGSAHGHNGVRSIQQSMGTTSLPRLTLGIGRPLNQSIKDFVLQKFTPQEQNLITERTIPRAIQLINQFVIPSTEQD